MKVWLKSKLADRVLSSVREELVRLINPDSTLLEVGCGTGDLLFRASSKLKHGIGVDINKAMIKYAEDRRNILGVNNISFSCKDALKLEPSKYDISTSTLCLHEIGGKEACDLLNYMVNNSRKVLIADYTSATTLIGKIGVEIDELFSGHYGNYRKYKQRGEISFYVNRIGATVKDVIRTKIDGISIWIIDGKHVHN